MAHSDLRPSHSALPLENYGASSLSDRSTAPLPNTPEAFAAAVSFAEVSRAVVAAAADLVTGVQRAVVGTDNIRTARDNAWDAMLADKARNQARADLTREVAQILRRTRVPAR
jgi:hypothetical protein